MKMVKMKMEMTKMQRPWVGVEGGILPIMESLCTSCTSPCSCSLTHDDDDDDDHDDDDDDDDEKVDQNYVEMYAAW